MKKKKIFKIFGIAIITMFLIYFFILFANIILLDYIKSKNTKTENEYFLSHAILLAKQNVDTTQEHLHDTSQKVQIVDGMIYFLDENNLYCYSGDSFSNKILIEKNISNYLIFEKKLYFINELDSYEEGTLFECEKDGRNPNRIVDNITDFTVEKDIILYVQSYDNGDKHKIIEYHKDTKVKKTLVESSDYSDYALQKTIFFNNYIIIVGCDTIDVYDRESKKIKNFLHDDYLWNSTVVPFVFEDNCYISIIYYDADYDLPIPPVDQERTGIWKFDFEQNKFVQVSKKHARYAEILGGELTLYNEFTFSPFLVKKYLKRFHPWLIYEEDSGL